VKGADFPVYIAGAKLLQNHPFGPLAGSALNVTLLSYDGYLDMGIHLDHGAITEPESLRDHIEKSFEELFSLVPVPEPEATTEADEVVSSPDDGITATDAKATESPRKKKRWFRKRT
jgi:hypothetical protein